MKILLDTHALLWWLVDDGKLGRKAREMIADPENDILVSAVSLWEIAVKARIGKLAANLQDIVGALEENGFARLGVYDGHLLALETLPSHHRDPFDHLLIAQAIVEDAVILSEDRNFLKYQVGVLACSA